MPWVTATDKEAVHAVVRKRGGRGKRRGEDRRRRQMINKMTREGEDGDVRHKKQEKIKRRGHGGGLRDRDMAVIPIRSKEKQADEECPDA